MSDMPHEIIAETADVAAAHDFFTAKMAFTTGPAGLTRAMETGEVKVIDVRAAKDFHEGHIPGSTSVLQAAWKDTSALSSDLTNLLVCYSPVCHLAAQAAVEFSVKGYTVMELDGGMREWREHGGSVEASPTSPRATPR